jgi:hypothetical protein
VSNGIPLIGGDAAAEIDALGAVIDLDQHCQRMARAGFPGLGACHRLGHTSRLSSPVMMAPSTASVTASLAGSRATRPSAEHLLRAVADASGDLARGEVSRRRPRALSHAELRQYDTLERLVVFPADKVAE